MSLRLIYSWIKKKRFESKASINRSSFDTYEYYTSILWLHDNNHSLLYIYKVIRDDGFFFVLWKNLEFEFLAYKVESINLLLYWFQVLFTIFRKIFNTFIFFSFSFVLTKLCVLTHISGFVVKIRLSILIV